MNDTHDERPVTLTARGFRRGFRTTFAMSLGSLAFGISLGTLAVALGYDRVAITVMSIIVYSGTGQMVYLDMDPRGASLLAIMIAVFMIAMRYMLMGITMRTWFTGLPKWQVALGLQYLADQSWALTLQDRQRGHRDAGYFFGSSAAMALSWIVGTILGVTFGGVIGDPAQWGFDFAATAVFVAILAGFRRTRADLLPWIVAGVTAIVVERWIGGYWHLFAGVAAGTVVGIVQRAMLDDA